MSIIAVSNAAQLTIALNSAKAGDTISLAAGNYGDVGISKQFSADVTITSQNAGSPAVFQTLGVYDSTHIKIDNVAVNFTPTTSTYSWSPAVTISGSSDVTFTHSIVTGGNAVNGVDQSASATNFDGNVLGMPTGYGISITGSKGVTVDDVEVSKFYKGIVLNKSDYVTIEHSDIHDTRTTPIVAGGGNHITVDANHLHDVNPWNWASAGGDHGDYLAMWTVSGQTTVSDDIKITNNLMEQGKGQAVLGMWLEGNGLGYANVQISGNAILGGNFQGIMTWGVHGGTIDHNTLLQTSGADWSSAPSILIGGGTTNIAVHDNLTSAMTDKSGSTGTLANSVSSNTIVTKWVPGAGYYTNDLILTTEAAYSPVIDGLTSSATITLPASTTLEVTSPILSVSSTTSSVTDSTQTVTTSSLDGDWTARTLTGGAGDDTFNSKNGQDTLVGGSGDDTYNLLANKTLVVEAAGGGIDTVIARGDYTLGDNVENLTISSSAVENWAGTGNSLNNVILGNAGGNFIDGMAGNDTINGGGGNDYISGGAGNDQLTGGAGLDTFKFAQGSGQDVITDFSKGDKDAIDVSAFLKAGYKATLTDVGADVKISFTTGDTITVTGLHASDLVATTTGYVGGTGTTTTPVATAPVVTAPVVTSLTLNGDWTARTLTGGAGDDTFNSKNGQDTLVGGSGDDTYNLLANKTLVVEAAGGGIDTVIARGDYTLGDNVENLTISSSAVENWAGTGNSLNNVILGNAGGNFIDGKAGNDTINGGGGKDYISGGAGNDQLTGGAGKDTFKFGSGSGQDLITDFSKVDHDVVDISAFTKAGYKATLTDVGTDVQISFSTGDVITLTGVHAKDLIANGQGFTI